MPLRMESGKDRQSFEGLTLRGRGAGSNASGRFERHRRSVMDDGWNSLALHPDRKPTTTHIERPKAIITRNQSPDVPFEHSVNAYRGCEHGCIYCFARPSHAYMGLSAGQDFETEIFIKPNAAALLEAEITRPGYTPRSIAMGTNTDPYQPIEKTQQLTRSVLEVLLKHRHPVSITTKSDRILKDLDILAALDKHKLVHVMLSVTTLQHQLCRRMEPRAASPAQRLRAIGALSAAGIPTGVMVAPVIPGLTDHELDWILAAAKDAGAGSAAWIMLRLPGEVAPLFEQWLSTHYPDRKGKILNALRDIRGGKLNDPRFGARMRGRGALAHMIKQRFLKAARRHGLTTTAAAHAAPDMAMFEIPKHPPQTAKKHMDTPVEQQLSLF
ncbi:MAG: PA0069 family radical SAM protein [Pseudomonadota bacterium]